jgi:hypothetical protein
MDINKFIFELFKKKKKRCQIRMELYPSLVISTSYDHRVSPRWQGTATTHSPESLQRWRVGGVGFSTSDRGHLQEPGSSVVSAPRRATCIAAMQIDCVGKLFAEEPSFHLLLHAALLLSALYNKLCSDSIENARVKNIQHLPPTATTFLQSRCFPGNPHFRKCPRKLGFLQLELSLEYGQKKNRTPGTHLIFRNLDSRTLSSHKKKRDYFKFIL